MFKPLVGLLGTLLCATLSVARSSAGSSVLVLFEPKLKQDDFSMFFNNLKSAGYDLTFRSAKDELPKLGEHGIPAFSHVVLFAPTSKILPEDINAQSIVSSLSTNPAVNFLIALSPNPSPLYSLASEFSLILPPPHTPLLSHFPPRPLPHTTIPISIPQPAHRLLLSANKPVLYSGVSWAMGDNPLLVPILNAPAESFATDSEDEKSSDSILEAAEKGGEGLWAGSKMGVVTGFQTANGARVTWVGGVDLFSDKFMDGEVAPGVKSGNPEFADAIAAWTFQESLTIQVENATHYLTSDKSGKQRDRYTTNDIVTFTMKLTSWNPYNNIRTPFGGLTDVQLEFTMLDPHIRTELKPVAGQPGTYTATFRVPDRHGVFKFIVDYRRKGYTPVHVALPVSIVPPRHDEYPRFLSSAWPYYTGAVSTSVSFILFCIVYLSGVDAEKKAKAKRTIKAE